MEATILKKKGHRCVLVRFFAPNFHLSSSSSGELSHERDRDHPCCVANQHQHQHQLLHWVFFSFLIE